MKIAMTIGFLLNLLLLSSNSYASSASAIEESIEKAIFNNFADVVSLIGRDQIGDVNLEDYKELVLSGSQFNSTIDSFEDYDEIEYSITSGGEDGEQYAYIHFVCISDCLDKLGISYAQAAVELDDLANSVGAMKSTKHVVTGQDVEEDDVSWTWTSGDFVCFIAATNGTVESRTVAIGCETAPYFK